MLHIGKRHSSRDKFKFFYCPLLEKHRKENYWFFWWFGKQWYICLPKRDGRHRKEK